METAQNKVCSKCNEEKPFDAFYKTKANKDGLQNICKKCDNNRKTSYLRKKSLESGKKQKQLTLIAKELLKEGKKRCPLCKEIKSLESFYTSVSQACGYTPHCILCMDILGKSRPKEEKQIFYQKAKTRIRNTILLKKYNISLEEYNKLLLDQNNVCAICGEKEHGKSLAVDHCHVTGKIRGLLCSLCNPAIGFLKNNSILAEKLANYLKSRGY